MTTDDRSAATIPSRISLVAALCLVTALGSAHTATAGCDGNWLVDPHDQDSRGQEFLDDFYTLLTDLTHQGVDETDQYAVHELMIDGRLFVTAPWFTSSTSCTGDPGALHDRIGDGPILIANPTLEHYLMVSDELSELAWVVSLGKDESLMSAIDRTVLAMSSSTYPGMPCWIAEVQESTSPPTIRCVSEDTATDATVRLGLAYYNAANNPYFSAGARRLFRARGDALAERHLEVEYLHETHTSGVTGRTMDDWVAGGGNTAQSLDGFEMFIGYHQDVALFLLAAYVSTGNSVYLDRAADVVDQWLSASSFDGVHLSFGAKKFRWIFNGSGELVPEAIEPWDVYDAPRSLWMGHVLRAYELATGGAPFTAPYASLSTWVQLLLASGTQSPTESCIEYAPDGTAIGNCGTDYYYHGLAMGLLTFHNLSWLQTKLEATLSDEKYGWGQVGKYWNYTPCFGIYTGVRPLKALASAVGLDAATYGGRRPESCLLSVARTGSGTGFVVSDRAGIDCGKECTSPFLDGETVSLAATPYQGSTFIGWSEPICDAGPVTLTADVACTADFDGACDPVVDLESQEIGDTQTFAGCDELRAGNGFHVLSGGNVTLRAGGRVVLFSGFAVDSGASLEVQAGTEP